MAIADALSFFNIKNGVIRVDVSEIELLPEYFIAVLKEHKDKPYNAPELYFVKKDGASYFYNKDKEVIEITKDELESRWNGIVFLVEKEETTILVTQKKSNILLSLPLLGVLFFLSTLFVLEENFITKLFLIFPLFGILFSVAALKNLFGAKSELINKFCNISSNASCATVVNSYKWEIFKFLNFSDLSVIFFTFQFLGLFALLLFGDTITFFSVQKILLLLSLPVVLLSLYYQKYVEKKWCPICLVIIGITILELIYLAVFQVNDFAISYKSLIVLGLVFSTVALTWFTLKKILLKQKELKEFQLSSNRFIRNYEIFKKVLVSDRKMELPYSPIIIGNEDSNTEITIITSPFCGYCGKVHEILEEILESNANNLKIKVIISVNIDVLDEEKKLFYRSLIGIYFEKGPVSFFEALHYWFEIKDLKDWIKRYELPFDSQKIDLIYRQQNEWCKNNGINFTPALFINGYQYPKTYDRENLRFFVNDLVEDDFFVEEFINY
ncbi:thioredoxin domain-containing protein [Flavobacterium sp. LPB0248]|uniref:thioredoxin domain-containing protein n=1 Tax=Flavobacterium sp. LPB0248 TaxID=2614441 RepID=UPI0015A592A1|nr:thioredoxin domain-containing protein [Flavobacterium sp. LPB0248]QLC64858.1 thioredoxin domain-containing protein [Flavobacterium sp. LPB0248]